jgi:phosphopantothenoylcysteine decarboxylase / phosphopantothenate---cysteine ligase
MVLAGKRIVLGITGGIAAYKTPTLVRRMRQAGAEIEIVLTRAAEAFVTANALAAVSGKTPRTDLFDLEAEAAMGHIELARWADCLLIAPATAHCVAQLAHGLAADLLTTVCLATRAPVLIAPAMNNVMWESVPVQSNIERLKAQGRIVVEPASGEQACGEFGSGRMPEPEQLVEILQQHFVESAPLAGTRFLITAGPTREAIDPVRFISNHSSGKQGYAIAAEAIRLGAAVTLITGPTALVPPPTARVIRVESARQMLAAVLGELSNTDIFIGVAAVADYRPRDVFDQKIKRVEHGIESVALTQNPDIIATVAAHPDRPKLVVGFAAETQNPMENARAKLLRKKLDAIVVNDVSKSGIGFNSDHNAATLINATGEQVLPLQPKTRLARELVLAIHRQYASGLAPTNPQTQP